MVSYIVATLRGYGARYFYMLLSVVLAVAFVAGTAMFTTNMTHTFDRISAMSLRQVDAFVQPDAETGAEIAAVAGLDVSFAEEIAALPEVRFATPRVQGFATVVSADGKVVQPPAAPPLAFGVDPLDPAPGFAWVEGRAPSTIREVGAETDTLEQAGLAVGDTTKIVVDGEYYPVTVVGAADQGAAAGTTLLFLDMEIALDHFAPTGTIQTFAVRAASGIDQETLAGAIQGILPDDYTALTGDDKLAAAIEETREQFGFLPYFFTAFGAVSVVVGGFLVFNTFVMVLAGRARELSVLRAIGVTQRQLTGVVVGEAALLGVLGGATGLGVGLGLAAGLTWLLDAVVGIRLDGLAPVTWTVVAQAIGVGVCMTVLAAIVPAVAASRIAPLEALRRTMAAESEPLRTRVIIGAIAAALSAVLAVVALLSVPGYGFYYGSSVLIGFAAIVLLSAPLVKFVMTALAWPTTRLAAWRRRQPVLAEMARDGAVRNPRRTALTATALMIGLMLVVAVGIIAESGNAAAIGNVTRVTTSDFLVRSTTSTLSETAVADVETTAGVGESGTGGAVPATFTDAVGNETGVVLSVYSNGMLGRLVTPDVTAGDTTPPGSGQLWVDQTRADETGLAVGDTLTVQGAALGGKSARSAVFIVTAVFDEIQDSSGFVVSETALSELGLTDLYLPTTVFVKAADSADVAQVERDLDAAMVDRITVLVQTKQEYVDGIAAQVAPIMGLIYGMLGLSIVIAGLGVINTMRVSLAERTRELGLLRAVGLTQRRLWRMVVTEALWITTFGAIVGGICGVVFGALTQRMLVAGGLDVLAIPWPLIAGVVVGASLLGVVAAAIPAHRAIRTPLLDAINS